MQIFTSEDGFLLCNFSKIIFLLPWEYMGNCCIMSFIENYSAVCVCFFKCCGQNIHSTLQFCCRSLPTLPSPSRHPQFDSALCNLGKVLSPAFRTVTCNFRGYGEDTGQFAGQKLTETDNLHPVVFLPAKLSSKLSWRKWWCAEMGVAISARAGPLISGSIGWRPGDVTALDRIQKSQRI